MPDHVVVEVLAAHADNLAGNEANSEEYLDLFPTYKEELGPLLRIADQVKAALLPVAASSEFEAGLKQDLLEAAIQRAEEREQRQQVSFLRRRGLLIGAAVGSVLSVAGIITALLLRQRSIARV